MFSLAGTFLPAAIFGFPIDLCAWHDVLAFNGEIIFETTLTVTQVRGIPLAHAAHVPLGARTERGHAAFSLRRQAMREPARCAPITTPKRRTIATPTRTPASPTITRSMRCVTSSRR
jgi:hypothetical protein